MGIVGWRCLLDWVKLRRTRLGLVVDESESDEGNEEMNSVSWAIQSGGNYDSKLTL